METLSKFEGYDCDNLIGRRFGGRLTSFINIIGVSIAQLSLEDLKMETIKRSEKRIYLDTRILQCSVARPIDTEEL